MPVCRLVPIMLFAGVAAVSSAPRLAAQSDMPVLHVGQRIDGTLSASDPFLRFANDSIRVKSYRFDAVKDRQYRIMVTSSDSNIEVVLAKPIVGAGLTGMLKADRHPLGGTISRIVFRASDAGPYLVVVGAANAGTGPYRLEIGELAATPPSVHPLALGPAAAGVLDDRDATAEETGTHYTIYELSADQGRTYRMTLTESGFDGRLAFGQLGPSGVWQEIAHSDSGGQGEPEHLSVIPQQTGSYQVRVAAVGTVDGGSYTLQVTEAPPPRTTPETRPITAGTDATGNLDESDALDSLGFRRDHWVYGARAGERVIITLSSTAFDAYLRVGRMSGGAFRQLPGAQDDDGGGGRNSRLELTLADSGEYVIDVSAENRRSQDGGYVVHVERLAQRPPAPETPKSRPIAAGQSVTASLDDTDARLPDGSPYQHWTITARSGERLVITMQSKALDAVLMVGRMENGQFKESWRDDDGGGGQDARIVMVAPQAGAYVIRANTFGPIQKGEYTLKVERTAPGLGQ